MRVEMMKFKTFRYIDNEVFKHEAFTMLIPEGWSVSGGITWRQHATMPGAIHLFIGSPDGMYQLNLLPSKPYYWSQNPLQLFGAKEGSKYMGNEVRRPVSGALQYLQQYILPKGKYRTTIIDYNRFPDLENALRSENQAAPGCSISIDAVIAKLEYAQNGYLFNGNITCGIVTTDMLYGQTSWIADKIISTRAPKGKQTEADKLFSVMLNSFKFNLHWFNCYHQFVQHLTQYVLQDIYNAGVISTIISNAFNHVSDTVRRSYENQQASNDRVFRGISESIRGVNSFYDPYKGYSVQIPNEYRYVYANPLGEYVMTDNPNFNPNVGSNLNWTILNRSY